METTSNARTRLIVLAEILTMFSDENNVLSLDEICEHMRGYGYNVSKRNIISDIKAVNQTTVKIIGVSKPKRGYYIVKSFSQDAVRLILEAIFSSDILSEDETDYIKKYLRRNACIPTLDLILSTTINLNSYAPKRKTSSEILNSLRLSIRDKKQVTLTVSRSKPGDVFSDSVDFETVTVNPVVLTVADGNVSFVFTKTNSPENAEYVNLPRIKNAEILKSDSAEFSGDLVSATSYFDSSPMETSYYFKEWLVIRFPSEYIELIENRFNTPVQFRKDEKKGYCNAKVFTVFDDKLLGWLFALSDKIEIIAPANIRQMFTEKAKNILNTKEVVL